MKIMRILPAVLVCAALGIPAVAADNDDPYLKVAAARSKVEIAIREGAPSFDHAKNGWNAAWQGADTAWNKINQTMHKLREAENRKQDGRDELFLQDIQAKLEAWNQEWQTVNDADSPRKVADTKLRDAITRWHNLGGAFNNVRQAEDNWKNSGMDLAMLQAVYATIEKQAVIIIADAKKAVDDVKAVQKEWTDKLAEAGKMAPAAAAVPAQDPAAVAPLN